MSSYRGNWRGVRGGRGYGTSSSSRGGWQSAQASSQPPSPPMGPLLMTFVEVDLKDPLHVAEDDDEITKYEDVASYNWMNEKESTIVVPGRPPAWTPLQTATKLNPDSGEYFRDQNAARSPAYPMEPAVRSIFTCQPDFQGHPVDLFACSSTLGNLFRYVDKQEKTFRMLVKVVGDTIFLVRRENSPTQLIPGITGFGHSFPEAYTTWGADVRKSESHQRIVRYKFGGLDLLMRFEADGYLKHLTSTEFTHTGLEVAQSTKQGGLAESLSSALQVGMNTPQFGEQLRVDKGGEEIPYSAIFDLKTRSFRRKSHDTLAEVLPRLYLAQIPNFIIAYHQDGLFDDIRVQDAGNEIDEWEKDNKDTLRRLGTLLRRIVAFARGNQGTEMELCRHGLGGLELREQSAGASSGALPAELEKQWMCGSLGDPETPADDADDLEAPSLYHSSGGTMLPEDDEREDSDSEKDYTACSAEDCGYCGHCDY